MDKEAARRPEELRELERRARRLAHGVNQHDTDQLLQFAEELERQARQLEADSAG